MDNDEENNNWNDSEDSYIDDKSEDIDFKNLRFNSRKTFESLNS